MKNGVVNIDIFNALDDIRDKYDVKAGEWARVAWGNKTYQTRISELRNLIRPFTYKKCVTLTEALRQIIGDKNMAKALLELIKKSDQVDERMILYCLAIPDADKPATEMYLKAVVERAAKD